MAKYEHLLSPLLIFGMSYYNFLSILDGDDFGSQSYFTIKEIKFMVQVLKEIIFDIFWAKNPEQQQITVQIFFAKQISKLLNQLYEFN